MKSLLKQDLKTFFKNMASEYHVIAPIKFDDGSVCYSNFTDGQEIDFLTKIVSPKFTLFPHTEQIL